jgi:hypothetical protein
MNNILQRISRRTLVSALAAGLAIGAIGLATPAAHAEPKTSGNTNDNNNQCQYDNTWYSPGAVKNVGTAQKPRYIKCDGKTGHWVAGLVAGGQFHPIAAPVTGGVAVAR